MRIGFGNDIHRLEEGRKLFLGGINLPYEKGCVAHSDGDVLIHALIDSIPIKGCILYDLFACKIL